jgi:hypothetical protein
VNIGWVLVGLALFCFVWFVGAVRERVAAGERAEAGNGSMLSTIVTVGGAAVAAVLLAVIGVADGVKTMSDDTYHHQVYPPLIHAANDAGYILHSAGGAGIGTLMIAASLAVVQTRALPVWLGWAGVAAGIIALASIVFFPWFLIALWLLTASVILFMSSRARPA